MPKSLPSSRASSSIVKAASSEFLMAATISVLLSQWQFARSGALRVSSEHSYFELWPCVWTEWKWQVHSFAGSVYIQHYGEDEFPIGSPQLLLPERVGILFQFPERFFLADTVLEEVTFGWPRLKADFSIREQLASNLQYALNAVGLNSVSLQENPLSLSGGFKRRLALAVQLVQKPDLLLLDEPLAGLDWKARADVVKLLKHLKKELTILVVSHDLKELSALVDFSWRMEMGGILKEEPLPL
ncbi:ABC transporter I family member 11, chloroplastic [Apostasia shenzhenica]|uniref:ABC transporter I family member 11, chloroplastic n=1 Tax=Apostasia shenzhenica TaxID=1088818 RepID=A0A2I0B6U7_9ASPA|nr:ABC transporter I family member 11, chloroplastic [Apostasia shenzhenica]